MGGGTEPQCNLGCDRARSNAEIMARITTGQRTTAIRRRRHAGGRGGGCPIYHLRVLVQMLLLTIPRPGGPFNDRRDGYMGLADLYG